MVLRRASVVLLNKKMRSGYNAKYFDDFPGKTVDQLLVCDYNAKLREKMLKIVLAGVNNQSKFSWLETQ